MTTRTITLHAFTSAKGGVGKSTLAVACARLLAGMGRYCVLIDADLTGSSLADGLRLCAPELALQEDGALDFYAPPTGRWLSRQETERHRDERRSKKWREWPPAPPYFNDILIRGTPDAECRIEALLWRHEDEDDGVWYLPSSPFEQDVSVALGWLYREEPHAWIQRVTWLLQGMSEQMPQLSDVVIDLPPGLSGYTHQVLALLSSLERPMPSGFPAWHEGRIKWRGNPFLVTTPDLNDLMIAMDYFVLHRNEVARIQPLLNRVTSGRTSQVREVLRERFGALGVDEALLEWVDQLDVLGALFSVGKLPISDEVRRLAGPLRLQEGARC